MSQFAIIATGGKQYRVKAGDVLQVEKLDSKDGDTITFSEVLFVDSGDSSTLGTPTVSGATVTGKIIRTGRGRKIQILKYKPKARYRVRKGHRQPYTEIEIKEIKTK